MHHFLTSSLCATQRWPQFRVKGVNVVELVRNLVAHGDAREGKWRGNWRMEWVASTLTSSPNVVYPALLKLMRTPRLPAVDWTDAPTDLNGRVRFGERRNLVSARVASPSARAITSFYFIYKKNISECSAYSIWRFQNTYTYLVHSMQNSDIPQHRHT
jgi:hypothetical protein